MVVGCQLLSMLNFVSMFAVFCFENFDNSTESWSLTLFEGLPYFLSRTSEIATQTVSACLTIVYLLQLTMTSNG